MKVIVIEVECCSACPYCKYYDEWNDMKDLYVCEKRCKPINSNTNICYTIDPNCNLEDKK